MCARFDDRGVPFSSNPAVWQPDPLDPGIRAGMKQQLIESALRRQAIAAPWEVDTARIQQDVYKDVGNIDPVLRERNVLRLKDIETTGHTADPLANDTLGEFTRINSCYRKRRCLRSLIRAVALKNC
jgi:hypothetical protein